MKINIGLLLLFLVCTSIYGRKDSKPSKSAKASTKSTKKSLRYIHYEAPVPVHVAEFDNEELQLLSAPSLEPTAEPSQEPTPVPSRSPSASPTAQPTLGPGETYRPTVRPTIAPTVKPTMIPTIAPTLKPTRAPTCRPTRVPTFIPTQLPTPLPGDPTLAPTPDPTASPSAKPTFMPTPVPSVQSSPIVSFTANLTMGGLTEPELSIDAQNAVLNVTASSMDIPIDTVEYVTGIATVESRRKLSDAFSLFATTYSILAVTKVVIPLSATSYADPDQLYESLTTLLTDAVTSGAFTEQLVKVSASFNASVLATADVSGVSNSAATVDVPSPPSDDTTDDVVVASGSSGSSDPALDDGAIAGIVIGGFFFLVLCGAAVYYFMFMPNGLMKIADSSLLEGRGEGAQLVSVVPH